MVVVNVYKSKLRRRIIVDSVVAYSMKNHEFKSQLRHYV